MSLHDWHPESLERLLDSMRDRPVPAALIRDVTEPVCVACRGRGFTSRDAFGVRDGCEACEARDERVNG